MLNHLLAGVLGLGGLSLFLSGFFFPEVRRQPDFAWSGVALLYALVLWIEGDSTSGGSLLGHIASVALILWFGWQGLAQRRQFAPPEDQTAIPGSLETLTPFLKAGWGKIIVAYGETAEWVQDKLGKEDVDTLPEMQNPLAPLQDASDEDWEAASPASSVSLEKAEEEVIEAIASHPESTSHPESALTEVPIETPPVAETLESKTDIELNPAQENLNLSPEPTPIQMESEELQSLATLEQQQPSDLENPAMTTATEEPTTLEIHPDKPQAEIVAEFTSSPQIERDTSYAERAEEGIHASTGEDDDGSWPPKEMP